jgi:hypothetical protein
MSEANLTKPDPFKTPIHPAALLFPELPADELRDLADNIKKHGLREPIALTHDGSQIVDGRNRLKGCKLAGVVPIFTKIGANVDPWDYVLSANLHRRHLTPAQRREVVAAVLKNKPEASNRRIAKQTKTHHETVQTVREEMEGRGEIRHVDKRTDTKGRQQPAERAKPAPAVKAQKPARDESDELTGKQKTEAKPIARRVELVEYVEARIDFAREAYEHYWDDSLSKHLREALENFKMKRTPMDIAKQAYRNLGSPSARQAFDRWRKQEG